MSISLRCFCAAAVFAALSGCVTDPKRVYVAQQGDAQLVMRTSGGPAPVVFSISSEPGTCKGGFEGVGSVSETGRHVLLPGIANLVERISPYRPMRQASVPTASPTRVKAYAFGDRGWGSCGPLVATFQADPGKAYEALFTWTGSGCRIEVVNVSEAADPKLLPAVIRACPDPTRPESLFMSADGRLVSH